MRRVAKIGLPVLLGVAVVAAVVISGQSLPDGPVPVVWDEAACAECRMHVGDPSYAAQLQTKDGEVMNFDDPGCLFRFLQAGRPKVHAIYFHDSRGEGWLRASEVAFVRADQTPMDYGVAAVRRGVAGAVTLEVAKRIAAERHTGTP